MVDERVMQFRLGAMTIASVAVAITLALLFGRAPGLFKSVYRVHVKFEDASGISRGTPVHKFGILIGRVTDVGFADDGDSALVTLEIDSDVRLRRSETFCIDKGLLGDAKIEVVKKTSLAISKSDKQSAAAGQRKAGAAITDRPRHARQRGGLAFSLEHVETNGRDNGRPGEQPCGRSVSASRHDRRTVADEKAPVARKRSTSAANLGPRRELCRILFSQCQTAEAQKAASNS